MLWKGYPNFRATWERPLQWGSVHNYHAQVVYHISEHRVSRGGVVRSSGDNVGCECWSKIQGRPEHEKKIPHQSLDNKRWALKSELELYHPGSNPSNPSAYTRVSVFAFTDTIVRSSSFMPRGDNGSCHWNDETPARTAEFQPIGTAPAKGL